MIQINLYIGSRYPVNRKKIRQAALDVLGEHKITKAQVDVSVVGDRKMKKLNQDKLKATGTTDVLSFPQHERAEHDSFPTPPELPPHLGDIVVSFPQAVKQAKRFGKRVDDQIQFFVRHGMMHLLGYHHD